MGQTAYDIESWLSDTLERGAKFLPPTAIKATWKTTSPALSPEVLSQWKQIVSGHPSHPLNISLAQNERRLRNGPDTIDYVLWFANDQLWRTAVDQSNVDVGYMDQGMDGRDSWDLNRDNMELRSAATDPNGPRNGESGIGIVRDFVSQGLTRFMGVGSSKPTFRTVVAGSNWKAEFGDGTTVSGVISGEWTDKETVRIDEISLIATGSDTPRARLLPSGVVVDSVLQTNRASQIEIRTPNSIAIIAWEAATTATMNEVAERAQAPNPTGSDPVRGKLVVRQVNDLRAGEGSLSFREADTWKTVSKAQVNRSYSHLRSVGWIIATIIVVIILGLRIRSVRAQQPS